ERLVRGPKYHFTRKHLAARGLEREVHPTAVHHVRRDEPTRVSRVALGGELRELALQHPERSDRTPELHALLRVDQRLAHDAARPVRRSGGETQASGVQHFERDLESLAHVAQSFRHRNLDVLEEYGARIARLDPHLVLELAE